MKKNRLSGQSLVEFVLIIPVVIFALTVFLDLGRAVYAYSALTNAVREGTRYAIVHPLEDAADAVVLEQVVKDLAVGLDVTRITVTVTPVPPVSPDYKVTIHAVYSMSPVTPGLGLILGTGNSITLNAESSMEVAPLYKQP